LLISPLWIVEKQLSSVTEQLAATPALRELRAALAAGSGALRVAPLISAARPLVVAALAQQHPAPLLYIVQNTDAALRALEDIRLYLGDNERVLLFPAADAMPYEQMAPGIEVIAQRLRVLEMLHMERSPVVVAPIKALLQPTLTPGDLAKATLTLERGQVLAQDALIRHLVEQGYRVVPSVEEPGELSRRGGIIDLWPPAQFMPLRVEWFDDEIDSLRRFDPASQRSEQRLDTVRIGPPSELPIWRREATLRNLFALDVSGLRKEVREEWDAALTRLELGEVSEGLSFYAPFFRGTEPDTLLTHLPAGAVVLLNEAQLLEHHADEIVQQAEERRERLVEVGELAPAYPQPYATWAAMFEPLSGQPVEGAKPGIVLVDLSNTDLPISNFQFPNLQSPDFTAPELFGGQFKRLVGDIVQRLQSGEQVIVVTNQAARVQELVEEGLAADKGDEGRKTKDEVKSGADEKNKNKDEGKSGADEEGKSSAFVLRPSSLRSSSFLALHAVLDAGWRSAELNTTLYTDSEIFGSRQRRALSERKRKGRTTDERAAFLRGLKVGDYVVHIEHGIAVYEGLLRRTVGEVEREYLVLRYAAGDKIYVPVDQVDRVARYIGAGDSAPNLTRLGTQDWERAKRKARSAVQDLAQDLLALYAKRQLSKGHAFAPDNEWQRELEDSFAYIETPDQLQALIDVKHDMEQATPMDRLVCGDVGFGKTEVALRAAFKAVQDGKQVAILVPTTVLAQQHFETFKRRMAAFPLEIEMLSRFRTPKEQEAILSRLARGKVDIIIGTHRLLSKDVSFRDLGLVVVDEEQRFGVRHKERLKQLRAEVDVLTLTATPIPRTLHMAMAGIRDLSVIDTPPEDRVPIKTFVAPYDDQLIREAILRELDRDGQVYFVHNRVQSIYHVATHLQRLIPEATFGVGHGQLEERELERVMVDFFEGRYHVLVCTTIIESGLDVPTANTIIIDDATHFGLAQLYQLRGRIGRSAERAYAYLLYRKDRSMTEEAQQRLEAIQEATELGAGFRVAMRDLEIRGAGNLLGGEQSGHIAAVGFDLYSRLLEQAVKQLKQQVDERTAADDRRPTTDDHANADDLLSSVVNRQSSPIVNEKVLVAPLVTLDLPLTAYLPEEYIADSALRLGVYQRMVAAENLDEVRELRNELRDRFGELPQPALDLLLWLQIKALALQAGVNSVITNNEEFVVRLPILDAARRERLRRRYLRDTSVKIGPQFVRLDRRALNGNWSEKLIGVLEMLKE
jgi:transcription-repair coupling factor (superfamily II helicase)